MLYPEEFRRQENESARPTTPLDINSQHLSRYSPSLPGCPEAARFDERVRVRGHHRRRAGVGRAGDVRGS